MAVWGGFYEYAKWERMRWMKIWVMDDSEQPDDDPNSEVQGIYYPGNNVGGALIGNTSNPLLYEGIECGSLGLLFYLLYKHKKETND